MTQCKYYVDCPANCSVERPMSVIEYFHRTYCQGNPSKCARFKVKEKAGKDSLPDDLLPNNFERANKIIDNN